jgi:hypothetical protein
MSLGLEPFLAGALSALQQRQIVSGILAHERAESDRQYRLRVCKTIEETAHIAGELVAQATMHPEESLVRVQFILCRLQLLGIRPELLPSQKEWEDLILLVRRLVNLSEKLQQEMSPDQLEKCNIILQAPARLKLARCLAIRLDAYNRYQGLLPSCQQAFRKDKRLKTYQSVGIIGCWVLAIITYMLLKSNKNSNDLMCAFILGPMASMIIINQIHKQRAEIGVLRTEVDELASAAGADDQEFWDLVRNEFGNIPTSRQVKKYEEEQSAIIKPFESLIPQ